MSAIGGKYEIGERLGGGGMADVFRATTRGAEGFARPVAIKRIKRSISSDKGFAELFVSEARLAAKLHHPNVVQTLDFDRDEKGCFYLVMELIDGVDLRALVGSGRTPVSACCFVVSELLRALDYAHELVDDGCPVTIIHRDISPHNIMLGWQGAVKVVDFGIAKAIEGSLISRSGSLKGKVAYMSPEQVHGHTLDGRSDLFAVGIILYELLTGTRLFVGRTEAETLSKVLTLPIANPRSLNDLIPPDLDAIVMRLLERDRAHRFSRARDAMEALLDCSVSITKGRRDLETLLIERFPDKAPKRTARLSQSPSLASSSSFESMPGASANPVATDAMAVAATIRAEADNVATKDTVPGKGVARPIAKRTFTAQPASPQNAEIRVEKSRKPRTLLVVCVLIVVAAAAALIVRGSASQEADSQSVALVEPKTEDVLENGLDSRRASVSQPAAPLDAGVPTADWSAGTASAGEANKAPVPEPSIEKRHKKAVLTLRVKPWATIIVDGKNYGQTPQTIRLERGKHRISLENPGIEKTESFSLTLMPGQRKTVEKDWR